jgi:hypothetical protein
MQTSDYPLLPGKAAPLAFGADGRAGAIIIEALDHNKPL